MAVSTTASQEEMKQYKLPIGFRDRCSACVGSRVHVFAVVVAMGDVKLTCSFVSFYDFFLCLVALSC